MQDLGRLAADLLLFYTQEFAFIDAAGRLHDRLLDHAAEAQSRCVRAGARRAAPRALACLTEALAICAKLPSGYQRDLQLLKLPLFRGIDIAAQTLDIVAAALDAVKFRRERIRLDPAMHAAEEAYALVVQEGIPFPRGLSQRLRRASRARTESLAPSTHQ